MNQLLKACACFALSATTLSFAVPALAEGTAPPERGDDVAAPSASVPVRAQAREGERVNVVLHADSGRATLERRDKVHSPSGVLLSDVATVGIATWSSQCTAPCSIALDPRYTYRIGGEGLVPSEAFVLPRRSSVPVTIDAKMGSTLGRLGGLAFSAAGAGGLVLGVTALAVAPILAQDAVGTPAVRTGVFASGVALSAVGALVFGTGLWLWTSNSTSLHPIQGGGIAF